MTFVDQEKLPKCGLVCQHRSVSASYIQCGNKNVLKTVECALRSSASGENIRSKSEQMLWSLLVKFKGRLAWCPTNMRFTIRSLYSGLSCSVQIMSLFINSFGLFSFVCFVSVY